MDTMVEEIDDDETTSLEIPPGGQPHVNEASPSAVGSARGQNDIIAAVIMIIGGIIMILSFVRMIMIIHDKGSAVSPVP